MQQAVAMGVAGADQLIGIRAMAELTRQAPSTVSRYVQRHPELGVNVDGQTKVWRGAYLAHRADNPVAEPALLDEPVNDARPPLKLADMATPARAAKTRHEEVRAELAEIELAEKKGHLVKASEVRAMIAEAAQRLRNELLSPQVDFAEQMRAADTPREAAAMLVTRNREMLNRFVDRLTGESEPDE